MNSQPDADTYRREIESLRVRLARALKAARSFASRKREAYRQRDSALAKIKTWRKSNEIRTDLHEALAEHGFSSRGLVHAIAHAYECLTELRDEIAEPNIHDGENTAMAAKRMIAALRGEIERLKFAHGHVNDRWIDGIDDRAELRRQRDLATQLLESIVDSAQLFTEARIYETDDSSVVSTALVAQAERLVKPLIIMRAPNAEQAEAMCEAMKDRGQVVVLPDDAKVAVFSPMGIDGPVRIAVSEIDSPLQTYAIHSIAQLHRDIEDGQVWLTAYAEHIESALKTTPRPVHLVPASEIDVHYRIGC